MMDAMGMVKEEGMLFDFELEHLHRNRRYNRYDVRDLLMAQIKKINVIKCLTEIRNRYKITRKGKFLLSISFYWYNILT